MTRHDFSGRIQDYGPKYPTDSHWWLNLPNDYLANESIDLYDVAIKFNCLALSNFTPLSAFDFSIDNDTPIFYGVFCNATCKAQA